MKYLLFVFFSLLFFFPSKGNNESVTLDSLLREARKFSFTDSAALFSAGRKIIEYAKKEKQPNAEAEINFVYGNFFYLKADYKRAEEYYSEAYNLAKKYRGDSLLALIEIRKSFIEFESGNWNKSEALFSSVLEKAEKSSDTISMIEALNGLAQVKEKKSERDETMKHYIRALSLAMKSGKKNETAYIFNNLGLLKFNTGQLDEAKKDLREALKNALEAGNDRIIANANLNLGLIYDESGIKDSALYFYMSFFYFSKKIDEPRSIATAYINLTSFYYDKKNYLIAGSYGDSAINLIREKNLVEISSKGFINKAQVLKKMGKSELAMKFLDSAVVAAKAIESFEDLAFCYNYQSEIMAEEKKFSEAFRLFQLYKLYNDSSNNLSAKKKMAELQVQYDVEQKENELLKERNKVEILEKENEIKKVRQKQILFFVLGFTLAVSAFFYIRYIRLSKKQQEAFSRKLIEDIEKERNRIAKDLHDDIGSSLSMIKNKIYSSKEKTVDVQEISADVSTVIEHTRLISHQLYPSYIEKTGLQSVIKEFTIKAEKDSGLLFLTEMDEINGIFLPEQKAHIFRIVQECVNNTLKYAGATAVKLSLLKFKNGIKMVYQDNGVGISKKNSQGGIGLMSIRERTKILGGDFSQGDNEGKGVKFTFTFFPGG